jgi:hypothetical protein
MRHAVPLLLSTAAVSLLAGCPDREVSDLIPLQGKVEYKDIPVTVNRDVDLLFVIDNSGSMGEEQASLKANFPKFIDVLSTIQGGLPNVHMAVINSDMGTLNGPAQNGTGGCMGDGTAAGGGGLMRELPGQPNVRYISDIKDDLTQMRTPNYTGPLSNVFAEIANVGTGGCGFESHLGAMRRSLENPANAGFLRDSAYLAVIIIADEDDCSLKPTAGPGFFGQPTIMDFQSYGCFASSTICDGPDDDRVGPRTGCKPDDNSQYHEKISAFVDFLKSKKTDPNLLIVAGIVGNSTPVAVTTRMRNNKTVPDLVPSCTYQVPRSDVVQRAFPAVRTEAFLKSFPNTTTTTICKGDLSDGLLQVATLLKTVIGSPCIDSVLAEPYQCSVLDVANLGKTNETRAVIARCDASHSVKPCWALEVDAAKCAATPSKLALLVDRGGVVPPKDTHVIANCVTK